MLFTDMAGKVKIVDFFQVLSCMLDDSCRFRHRIVNTHSTKISFL